MACERLEDRALLSSAPYGALPDDTGEYMLGKVLVSVVLMESSSNTTTNPFNPNTETWTPAAIAAVKQKVATGINWWKDTLATEFPAAYHPLDFQFDYTYADSPVQTRYEPIANTSDAFESWVYDFLNKVGYNATGSFEADILTFNNAQRLAQGTDWAFTVFVVNDANDTDGRFATGSTYSRAFSYFGGKCIVSPAGRPASTFAHETGHIFWARDEYYTSTSTYNDRSGYYNTQNTNGSYGAPAGFVQAPSIMTVSPLLDTAYNTHVSSASSLAMIGWQDSDGDGVFDVLDVPFTLTGSGSVDLQTGQYVFHGSSAVQTLPNRNSWGLQSDITVNRIRRAEYRIDGGTWQTAAAYDTFAATLDLRIPLPDANPHAVEIRTWDDVTGAASPIFQGSTATPATALQPGLTGFVWEDVNQDGQFQNSEPGLADWTVRLVDGTGQPLNLGGVIEPDSYSPGYQFTTVQAGGTTLQSAGLNTDGRVAVREQPSNTANRVFYGYDPRIRQWTPLWTADTRTLRLNFAAPVSALRLSAIGSDGDDEARLEVYDSNNRLLARDTTSRLAAGQVETMTLLRSTPDIAYAIARAHTTSVVYFDSLWVGPDASTLADADGAYSLPSLPAGAYTVEAVPPKGGSGTAVPQSISLSAGQAASLNVAVQYTAVSWCNPVEPTDVNGDGKTAPVDVLLIINYINAHSNGAPVPSDPAAPPPYYDVDGNRRIAAADVLQVVNYINLLVATHNYGGEASLPSAGRPRAAATGAGEAASAGALTRDNGIAAPPASVVEPAGARPAPSPPRGPSRPTRPAMERFAVDREHRAAIQPDAVDAVLQNGTVEAAATDFEFLPVTRRRRR